MNKSGKLKMYKKEGSEERKMRSLENLEIKSHLSTLISHISGITLVALVVTIVVLLILAGVTITALLGDDGIIKKAQNAADSTNSAVQDELAGMNSLTDKMNSILNGNGGGGDDETILPADGSFNETKGVNTPNLGTNMSLVKFDETTQDWVVDETNSAYSYKDTEAEGANSSEWANAKVTVDGIDSYFVWIPRYAYKITYYTNADKTTTSETPTTYGTIDIKFLKDTGNIATDGVTVCKYANENLTADDYIIHPAFTADVNYGGGFGNNNGTNDNGISGIWIGKYEASLANKTDGTNIVPSSSTDGNFKLADQPDKTIVTKPGYSSWRYITIGNMYDNAKAYNTDLKSHMLKNSEWGAVAYLTESKYGRNGTEIGFSDEGYITGGGEGKDYAENNQDHSTTGNVYGIYDMRGGAYEYVASYYNGSSSLSNGSSFASVNGFSTKYATAYTGTSAKTAYKYGDATYETSGWHSDFANFVNSDRPFFERGGNYINIGSRTGVFYCSSVIGNAYDNRSFRLALVS